MPAPDRIKYLEPDLSKVTLIEKGDRFEKWKHNETGNTFYCYTGPNCYGGKEHQDKCFNFFVLNGNSSTVKDFVSHTPTYRRPLSLEEKAERSKRWKKLHSEAKARMDLISAPKYRRWVKTHFYTYAQSKYK